MTRQSFSTPALAVLALAAALVAGCAPAAPPSPTAAPPKPAATTAPPPQPAATAKPAATAAPAKPAASPVPSPAAAAKPTAKVDTKAVEEFYKGKTLRFITGFSAGGLFDNYTRAVARHATRHIPGSPNIVVENMTGAGGLIAANYVYNVAPKDGTVLVNLDGAAVRSQALGQSGVEFDARRYNWLPSPGPDVQSCWVTKASGWTSIAEAIGSPKELILGGLGPGSFPSDNARILQTALGLNAKVVDGYAGVTPIRLAAEQGEVHGSCSSLEGVIRSFSEQLKSGEIRVIAQVGEKPWPGFEQVPNALDLAKTDESKQLLRVGIVGPNDINRLFGTTPTTPPERVEALRKAFDATYADPEFTAELEKAKLTLRPISVQRINEVVTLWLDMPADQKAKMKTILKL